MGSTLRDLKSQVANLIQLPMTEIYLERGRDIRELLEDLSKYPFDPINKFNNRRAEERKNLSSASCLGGASEKNTINVDAADRHGKKGTKLVNVR